MDDGQATSVVAWASLQLDLLLQILRRLESTAVIRCAGACRPWRRAIIGNASLLRPRPDCFVPSLLLGVFHGYGDHDHQHVYLRRTPGPFQSMLPSTSAAGSESRIQSLIPVNGSFDREMYTDLLSSRNGFILLIGRRWWSGVCLLCNPMTGDCKILPDATIRSCTYILLSVSGTGNAEEHLAVRILAVAGTDTMCTKENRITYQVFSFTSGGSDGAGAWGPVKRSDQLKNVFWVPVDIPCTVVYGHTVYWLGGPKCDHEFPVTWTVALDVHTGRTWTTELPDETKFRYYGGACATPTLLATSGDGRLTLIGSLTDHQIKVWVLVGDGQWNLQKRIDVQELKKQLPHYWDDYFKYTCIKLNAFCPRSGCVIGRIYGHEIRIDLQGSSRPCVEPIGTSERFYYCNNVYEMNWLTYISKMKQF